MLCSLTPFHIRVPIEVLRNSFKEQLYHFFLWYNQEGVHIYVEALHYRNDCQIKTLKQSLNVSCQRLKCLMTLQTTCTTLLITSQSRQK